MLGQRGEPEAPWGNATAQALKQPTSPSHQGQVVGHEVEVGASALRNQAGWEGGVVRSKRAPRIEGRARLL